MKISDLGRHAVGVGLAVALLVGCAGAGSPPQLGPTGDWFDAGQCKSDHGVSVKPCSVVLTFEKQRAKVTTRGPKGGTFTYKDAKCVSEGIAEVNGSDNKYVVSPGTVQGECTATFIDKGSTGKTIGTARLSIAFFKHHHCPPTCQILAPVAQ
jgi:hypothetical protein